MDEDQLLSILRQEEQDSASYYDSELAAKQAEAMKRYNGEPYGDEVSGRSQVVTRDVADTINWIMPHLMRTFAESDELITVDDPGLEDGDQTLKDASDYLTYVFFEDNDGEFALHDFAFDGLLQRVGVMRAAWVDPEDKPAETLEGLSAEHVIRYVQDPTYEVLSAEQMQLETGEPSFALEVKKKPGVGRVLVEAIPPEEFRISRRAKSIKVADYHAWRHQVYMADVIKAHPEKKLKLDPDGVTWKDSSATADDASDERKYNRFPDEPEVTSSQPDRSREAARRKVWELIEYIRIDYDGDGIVELRRVKRVGSVILENDRVDDSEFVSWSPIRVSHRAIGESLAETLATLQKIRTVLTRAALDSLNRSLLTTTVISEDAISAEGDTLARLLDHDIGGVIPVKGDVRAAILERTIPDVSANALAAIEYFDRRSEEASGVNRHAQGIAPEAITQTKGGIEMLQAAANSRVEQIARWISIGIEEVFEKILKLLAAHQDQPRMIKVNGRRIEIDPRRWSDEMTVSVHVGMAAESRDKRLVNLNLLAQKQEAIMTQTGLANPLVGPKEYRNTLAGLTRAMGFKDAKQFFKELPEGYQPPPAGPDPKTAEVQGKLQLQQADMQAKQQMQAQELAHKQEIAQAQAMIDAKANQQKAETDKEIAAIKLQGEQQIAAAKVESERMIAEARMMMEERLAIMRMEREMEMARWKAQLDADTAKEVARIKGPTGSNGSSGGDGVGGSYRPGGKLDA